MEWVRIADMTPFELGTSVFVLGIGILVVIFVYGQARINRKHNKK